VLLLSVVTRFLGAARNVTTVLLIVPGHPGVTHELKVPAYPFLFAEVARVHMAAPHPDRRSPTSSSARRRPELQRLVVNLDAVIVVVMIVQA